MIERAKEIDTYGNILPELEIGDEVTLADVWDGEGEIPQESYSYQLNDTDIINYEFEVIEKKEELDTVIRIIDICIL